jgi:hypothetical protein
MGSIMTWVTPILSILSGILGSVLGASPFGAIFLGVLVLLGGGTALIFYNKYKNWQFDLNQKNEQKKADEDHAKVIKDNQGLTNSDNFLKSEQEKKELEKKLNESKPS